MAQTPTAGIGHNAPPSLDKILADKHADLVKRQKAWKRKAEKADLTPKTIQDCAALNLLFTEGDAIMKDAEKERVKEKEPFLAQGRVVDGFFNADIRDAIDGLAQKIKRAAAAKQLEITRAEQAAAALKAEAERKKADDAIAKANEADQRGDVRQGDVFERRAQAADTAATQAESLATADVRTASRTVIGGVSASVGVKNVCTGIDRKELDLEALRPFLKEADLIAAVTAYLRTGETKLKGAHIVEEAVSNVRAKRG